MPPKKRDEKKEEEEQKPVEDNGTYVFDDNSRYAGQVLRKESLKRNGTGVQTDPATGMSYNGAWKDDMMHGEGILTFPSGATYSGSFYMNKFDGKGLYKWTDGSWYDGPWRNNRMHGEGTYCDAKGEVWHGRFYNGTGPGLVGAPTINPGLSN